MNKGMDKHDTWFVSMKTSCKESFSVFSRALEKMSQSKTIFYQWRLFSIKFFEKQLSHQAK